MIEFVEENPGLTPNVVSLERRILKLLQMRLVDSPQFHEHLLAPGSRAGSP